MRLVLFISISFFSCNSVRDSAIFLPEKYFLPEDQINSGKTFIYLDRSIGETSYIDYYFGDNNGRRVLVQKAYLLKGTNDSQIYFHRRLIESYSNIFNTTRLTKANIFRDTIIENGKRLGKHILSVSFESDSTIWKIISESEFMKDTIFTWKGKSLPTLVINTTYNTTIQNKFDRNENMNFKIEFNTYEAEKIGSVRLNVLTTTEHKPKIIDLIEIKDLSDK